MFSKNFSCSDCQQHCCRFICQINSKTTHCQQLCWQTACWESQQLLSAAGFMCCSEWLECLSWNYTEFFSSARLNNYIYHYLSYRQHCWRVTSQLFNAFGDLNLNQRRFEQDPGLGGPVGGLRTVYIKFEIINFQFANWVQKHSGWIYGNIF